MLDNCKSSKVLLLEEEVKLNVYKAQGELNKSILVELIDLNGQPVWKFLPDDILL
jgi:hypothetical protein